MKFNFLEDSESLAIFSDPFLSSLLYRFMSASGRSKKDESE